MPESMACVHTAKCGRRSLARLRPSAAEHSLHFADQFRADAIGVAGNTFAHTPKSFQFVFWLRFGAGGMPCRRKMSITADSTVSVALNILRVRPPAKRLVELYLKLALAALQDFPEEKLLQVWPTGGGQTERSH
jgi:hypothetical protein